MNRVRAVVPSLIVPAASLTPLLAAAQTLPDTPGAAHRPTFLLPGKHDRTPPLVDLPPLPIENEQDETPHPPLPVRGDGLAVLMSRTRRFRWPRRRSTPSRRWQSSMESATSRGSCRPIPISRSVRRTTFNS